MKAAHPIWLVNNASSGNNDDAAIEALRQCCTDSGLSLLRHSQLPDDDLPTPQALDAAGVGTVVVYAGDGTTNALITALSGWSGAVLVLPGGTKNLLFHRLHEDRTLEQVVAAYAAGKCRTVRPDTIMHAAGVAYAEVLAGPGATWGRVREAMRDAALGDLADATAEAMGETLGGEPVACVSPALGRPEGYPLLLLRAQADGMELTAYRAEGAAEFLEQAWAMVTRNFREGPNEALGSARQVRLAGARGGAIELLIDGEQAQAASPTQFTLAPCAVDLLATGTHDI